MSLDNELFSAIEAEDYNKVRILVDQGADLNIKDNTGTTPLHLAANSGNLDITKYLIDKGANINTKDNDGWTPLHFAAFYDHLDVIKYLIDTKGADFNLKDNDGWTPSHFVAASGNLAIVQYLVEKGADFNLKNNDGNTPLHWAIKSDKSTVIQYLIDKWVNSYLQCNPGNTPLHLAAHFGNLDIAQYFVDKGADFNLKNGNGHTPLHLAAHFGNLDIIKYLIDKGANFDAKDSDGWTPLHFATFYDNLDIVQYIIDSNIQEVDFNAKSNDGWTPLHLAAESGNLAIVQYLVEKGADLYAKDKNGNTPLALVNSQASKLTQYLKEASYNRHSIESKKLPKETKATRRTSAPSFLWPANNVHNKNSNTPLALNPHAPEFASYFKSKGANNRHNIESKKLPKETKATRRASTPSLWFISSVTSASLSLAIEKMLDGQQVDSNRYSNNQMPSTSRLDTKIPTSSFSSIVIEHKSNKSQKGEGEVVIPQIG